MAEPLDRIVRLTDDAEFGGITPDPDMQ